MLPLEFDTCSQPPFQVINQEDSESWGLLAVAPRMTLIFDGAPCLQSAHNTFPTTV